MEQLHEHTNVTESTEKPDRIEESGGKIWYVIIVVIVLLLDQVSKYYIVSGMELYETIPVIQDFFHITYIFNTGASFGLLQDQTLFFTILSGCVILAICWAVFFWKATDRYSRVLLGFVTGGALGNLADRLQHGAVVDFFDFRGIWPYIFNIADMAVVCGGLALAVVILVDEFKNSAKARKPRH